MSPPARNSKFRILPSIVLLFVAVAGALGVSEVVLRWVDPPWNGESYFIWPPGLYRTLRPEPAVMPGVTGDARFMVNSQGFRADEPTAGAQRRILVIGGSTTECLYLDQTEAWPRLLQDRIPGPVWVGNAGMAGMTTRHHLVALRHLPLRELGINTVVVLTGVNDLTRRLSQDIDWRTVDLNNPAVDLQLTAENFVGSNIFPPDAPFYERTALWTALRKVKRLIGRVNVQDEAGEAYREWQRHRQRAGRLLDSLPDLSVALDEYEGSLMAMTEVARRKAVRLILVTQPTMWRTDLPPELQARLWLGGVGDFMNVQGQPYYSVRALTEALTLYNDRMRKVCAATRTECIDLAAQLPQDTRAFYDDVHFNENGARLVADIVATRLLVENQGYSQL